MYLAKHLHTGEQISDCLEKKNISVEKILLVISDNGANMVKGIKLVWMRAHAECDILSELENEAIE